jgi:DNA-directed RNA polymerase subunit M/transcription elongation factor TFIIS
MREKLDDIPGESDIQGQMKCLECGGTEYRFSKRRRRVKDLVLRTIVCVKCGEKYGIPEEIVE